MKFKIEKLTDKEHILRRPSMYIGGISNEEIEDFVYRDSRLIRETLTYPPGLVKIINEVIDNAIDAILKTNKGNQIRVTLDDLVEVEDNSSGFPIKQDSDSTEPVVLALGNARAGSNFNDEENLGQMGTNGVGAFATNCFSLEFQVTSVTDNHKVQAFWHNNGTLKETKVSKTKEKSGTKVCFKPDLAKFGVPEISQDVKLAIKTRLFCLAYTYPKIKFFYNGDLLQAPKSLIDCFTKEGEPSIHYKTENYEIMVIARNEQTANFSFVNGLNIRDGGSHLDIISNDITKALQNQRGVNALKSDILNTLQIIFVGTKFKGLRFNSQTKEKITNSAAEVRSYLGDLKPLTEKVAKSKAIKDFIKATSQAREFRANKAKLNAVKRAKIKSDKFLDSQGDRKYLMLVEGDSALGGLVPALGRREIAYYALKGKPLNAYSCTPQKLANNKELADLLNIMHNSSFEYLVFATDQDLDGFHIRGLLLGFVYRYLPEMLDNIYFLQTPVRGIMKDGVIQRWSFNLQEDLKIKSNERAQYYKGLGSWDREDLQKVLSSEGLEGLLQKVTIDPKNQKHMSMLEGWLGDNSDIRKELILANDFNIARI